MPRRMLQFLVALMVAALPLVVSVAPARADNASALLGLVNALRASHGLGPLYVDPTLTATAQSWSAHMASGNALSHNPNVGAGLAGGWTKLGENVGEGGTITGIYNAFVNSAFHLGNMLDPTYNLTGVAVAVGRSNTLWVTQDFEAKPGATPATTRPPATTPTTAKQTATTTKPTTTKPVTTTPPVTASAAATTTSPPPTTASVPTTVGTGDSSVVPDLGSGAPATPPSSVPGKLAAAASLAGHGNGSGSMGGLVGALAGLAVISLGATAFYIKRLLRSP
jgi:hypothetical protein